ncbi:type 2 lanthipeptide synthetase LanM [Dolosigranulum pigrum]|uniref:type 2 lanthipeptide synthetase LanM n=1 Tax=Dolosigranulum pigrum TaxID=29394 RepID=UPI001AD8767E|nr:type 2 lanthipeptide synthetase LanM [Dolosigranulum pigrum]QTJ55624.1 type 2 lantipeptide synthetase LanM [Dolosigranulum pigrum]
MIKEIKSKFTNDILAIIMRKVDDSISPAHLEYFSNKLIESISRDITNSFQDQIFDVIIVEFHKFREHNNFKDVDTTIDEFSSKIDRESFVEKLFFEYPLLEEKILSRIKGDTSFINKMLWDVRRDQVELEEAFNIDIETLCNVYINMGDKHDNKSVTLLKFKNKNILYKPREIVFESTVETLIDSITESKCLKQEYIRRVKQPDRIIGKGYYWEEYIHEEKVKEEDIDSFYYTSGVYLALFYILNITDIHFENILLKSDYPIFVDLEVGNIKFSKYEIKNNHLLMNNSVLMTGLLPIYDKKLQLNMSGLFSHPQETNELSRQVPKYDKKLGIVYKKEAGKIIPKNANLSHNNKKIAINYLLKGMSDCLHYIRTHKRDIVKQIDEYDDFKYRVLLRHTSVYFSFIEALNTPKALRDKKQREKILNILEDNYIPNDGVGYVTLFEEIAQLKEGNIPIFKVPFKQRGLYVGDEEILNEYVDTPLKEVVISRISCLDNFCIDYQLRLIKLSIASTVPVTQLNTLNNVEHLSHQKVADDELKQNIGNLLNNIGSFSFELENGGVERYDLQYGENAFLEIAPQKFNLYDTLANIALFYVFGNYFNEGKYEKIALSMYKNISEKVKYIMESDSKTNDEEDISVFEGISGVMYVSYYLYTITQSERYLEDTCEIYKFVIRKVKEKISHKKMNLDYISGLSGIGLLLINILKHNSKVVKESDLMMIKGEIEKNYHTIEKNGLAHGKLGPLLFLIEYNLCVSRTEDEIKNIGDRLLALSLDTENNTWCNGLSGYLYVLNEYKILLNDNKFIVQTINSKIKTIIDNNILKNKSLSLCHGVFGNIEVLLKINENINIDRELNKKINLSYIKDLTKIKWCDLVDVTASGFMTGATGIAYELMRIRNKKIPSIMFLEFFDDKGVKNYE